MENKDEDIERLENLIGFVGCELREIEAQSIENVLSRLKKYKDIEQDYIANEEKLADLISKLETELETYKKIAEEIEEMFAEECVRLGSYEKDNSIPEKERIAGGVNILNKLRKRLDWARKEVEKDEL